MNDNCSFRTEMGHYLSHPTVEVSPKGEAQQFRQKHLAFLTDDMNFLGCFDRQPTARQAKQAPIRPEHCEGIFL